MNLVDIVLTGWHDRGWYVFVYLEYDMQGLDHIFMYAWHYMSELYLYIKSDDLIIQHKVYLNTV